MKSISLKAQLLGSFAVMGFTVLVVALVGWNGSSRLNKHITTLGDNSLRSVIGWNSVDEGLTAIAAAEQALLNTELDLAERKAQIQTIDAAFQRIDEGTKLAEATASIEGEEILHDKFIQAWNKWKQNHEQFIELNQEFEQFGISNPLQVKLNLLSQDKGDAPEMVVARNAAAALAKLYAQENTKNLPSYKLVKDSLGQLLDLNERVGIQARQQASHDANQTTFWLVLVVFFGPLTAVCLGLLLSNAITRSMNKKIDSIAEE